MKSVKLSLSILLICTFQLVKAQEIGVDRKNKSIFTYYSKDDSRLSLTADGNLSYAQIFNPTTITYKLHDDTTVTKFRAWTFKVSLTSDEDFLNSEKLSKLRPGIEFKFGRQTSVDTFKHLDRTLPHYKKSVKTYGWNLVAGIANVKLYDSEKKTEGKRYPGTIGLEGNYNMIFKNRDTTSNFRKVLAFTGAISWTSNQDDLTSYQKNDEVTSLPDIVTLEEFEGKYGTIERIADFRLSGAFPMYIGHFNPIPFVAFNAKSNEKPAYYVGAFINYNKDKLDRRAFQIPSSIGFGIDLKYTGNKFDSPVYFIKGEIKF